MMACDLFKKLFNILLEDQTKDSDSSPLTTHNTQPRIARVEEPDTDGIRITWNYIRKNGQTLYDKDRFPIRDPNKPTILK